MRYPGNLTNQSAIADAGGIAPLVNLLKVVSKGSGLQTGREAQETAAGALYALAESSTNRVSIAEAGGIPLLVALLDGGSEDAKEQAAGASPGGRGGTGRMEGS